MSDTARDVGHTDSRDSHDSNLPNGPEKKKSRRPASQSALSTARDRVVAMRAML